MTMSNYNNVEECQGKQRTGFPGEHHLYGDLKDMYELTKPKGGKQGAGKAFQTELLYSSRLNKLGILRENEVTEYD